MFDIKFDESNFYQRYTAGFDENICCKEYTAQI